MTLHKKEVTSTGNIFMRHVRQLIGVMCIWLVFWFAPRAGADWNVAIFDYDDRLHEADTVAKYLERQLNASDPAILVEQFSGKGDEQVAIATLKELDQASYDLIITITSDALILAQHFLRRTPTLYTNVNDPLSLGVATLDAPGGNISGASYYVPVREQLALFTEIQPDIKTIGFIFDETNRSRQAEVRESRNTCHDMGLRTEIRLITRVEELPEKVTELLNTGVDAIVATSSETIYDNIARFKPLCDQAGIPIYAYHRNAVERGAIAALASDYYVIAEQLVVPMALRVLREHISPGTLPAAFLEDHLIFINLTEAKRLGLRVPPPIVQRATKIY